LEYLDLLQKHCGLQAVQGFGKGKGMLVTLTFLGKEQLVDTI